MEKVRRVPATVVVDEPRADLPAVLSPALQAAAVRLITRAEAMGLVSWDELPTFSVSSLDAAMRAFAAAGIGRGIARPTAAEDAHGNALELMNSLVEDSPHPASEWSSMLRVLTSEPLAKLLGVSESSIRRYSTGERPTPQQVAVRLHWLAMRVADLAGAYNHYGIVRWFDRRRRALADQSPAERLTGNWSPDDERVIDVAELAANLTVMSAT